MPRDGLVSGHDLDMVRTRLQSLDRTRNRLAGQRRTGQITVNCQRCAVWMLKRFLHNSGHAQCGSIQLLGGHLGEIGRQRNGQIQAVCFLADFDLGINRIAHAVPLFIVALRPMQIHIGINVDWLRQLRIGLNVAAFRLVRLNKCRQRRGVAVIASGAV